MPNDLGPLPMMHPRETVVREAEREIDAAILEVIQKHKLTTGEILQVINNCFSREIGLIARQAIRHERHGHGDKPGGTA